MKKFFCILLMALFACSTFFGIFSAKKALAIAVTDQSCDLSGGGGVALLGDGVYQTFTPSKNRLVGVEVNIDIEGLVNQDVSLSVYHGGSLVVNAGSQSVPSGRNTLDFILLKKKSLPRMALIELS